MQEVLLLLVVLNVVVATTQASKLCKIHVHVSESDLTVTDYLSKINESGLGGFEADEQAVVEVYADTHYQAVCLTYEKVRGRNALVHGWTNANHKNTSDENFTFDDQQSVANRTSQYEQWSYLTGSVNVGRSLVKYNNYLLCRFLAQDPSVWCEQIVHLRVKDVHGPRISLFFVLVCLLAAAVALNATAFLAAKQRSRLFTSSSCTSLTQRLFGWWHSPRTKATAREACQQNQNQLHKNHVNNNINNQAALNLQQKLTCGLEANRNSNHETSAVSSNTIDIAIRELTSVTSDRVLYTPLPSNFQVVLDSATDNNNDKLI